MRASAGADATVSHQLLVVRDIPSLDAGYARALVLSMKLSDETVLAALQLCAAGRPAKRQRSSAPCSETKLFYHGTSKEKAHQIIAQGFKPSTHGFLGPGIYVAHHDKAAGYACRCERHGGDAGATLQVRVTFTNAKFVPYDDQGWQAEGYDACRADRT